MHAFQKRPAGPLASPRAPQPRSQAAPAPAQMRRPRVSGDESPLDRQLAASVQHRAQTLPDTLRAGVEHLSGIAMDDVRVHYNSPSPARVGALAYTLGTDIHIAPGQERHLPHEAWHVVQQLDGRVRPTTSVAGTPVNADPRLEGEADVMGARAAQQRALRTR